MVALNFPSDTSQSPYTENGITYVWDGKAWNKVSGGGAGGDASITVSDTPPNPGTEVEGELWWDSSDDSGRLYVWYDDGNTQQWVETSPSGSGGGGGIEEAPTDGQQYARQNEAWSVVQGGNTINYNGAAAWGDINDDGTILGGLNVASVVRTPGGESAGDWTVTFANPMPNINYAVTTGGSLNNISAVTKTVNGFRVQTANNADVLADSFFYFAVHALNALPPQGGTGTDAWATVDRTTANGACNVPGSFNIASVTRVSEGNYDVVFTTPMPNANYSVAGTASDIPGTSFQTFNVPAGNKTADGFRVSLVTIASVGADAQFSFAVNATNASLPNTITEDQIAALIQNPVLSAWAYVTMDSDGTNIQVVNGYNVSNVTRSAQGNFTVIFTEPLAPNYSAVATSLEAGGVLAVDNTIPTSCRILMRTTADSATPFDGGFFIQFAGTARNGTLGGGADAWGNVSRSTDATATLNGGLNCTVSTTVQPDGTVVAAETGVSYVTFTNPMPNGSYSVVGNTRTAGMVAFFPSNPTAQGFTVRTQSDIGGTTTTSNRNYQFAVFATDGNAGGFWVREGQGANEVLKPLNNDATIEAAALSDGNTTKTMTDVLAGGGGGTTINYNGAAAWGSIAQNGDLEGTLNIDDVIFNSAGDYTVSFTNPMPNTNYSVVATPRTGGTRYIGVNNKTVNGFDVVTFNDSNTPTSSPFSFAVHALNALPPMGGTGTDAWGVFSGSDPGTIQGSFNIASITRNSVGNYSVVFTNSMPDTQYAVVGSCWNAAADTAYTFLVTNKSSTGFDYVTLRDVGQAGDGTISYSDQAASFTVNASSASLPATITEDQIAALIQNPVLSAWGSVNAIDGSLADSFNIASCVKANAVYTITFTNPLPTADYAISGVARDAQAAELRVVTYQAKTTNGFQAFVRNTNGVGDGNTDFSFQVAGTARNGTLGGGADAWGDINGAAATPDADRVLGGFNIQSVQRTGDGQYTINFVNDMPNTNYSVVASPVTGVNADRILVGTKQVDSFTLSYFNTIDTGVNANFNFAVFATDGNAGGFWVKTGDELAPLSATADVKIGGGDITLNADGSATLGGGSCVITNNGIIQNLQTQSTANTSAFTFIGRDAQNGNANTFTVSGGGDGTFAGQGTFGTPSVDEGVLIGDEGFLSLRKDGALYSSFNIYNGSFDNAGRKVSINNDGSAEFAGGDIEFGGANFDSFYKRISTNTTMFALWSDSGGTKTAQFLVTGQGQIQAQNTTIQSIGSERRIKENISLIDPSKAWDTIKSVPYYSYQYINKGTHSYGPIVDELPSDLIIEGTTSDDQGNIRTYDNGLLQARLFVALQESLKRIETLESRLSALEGGNN